MAINRDYKKKSPGSKSGNPMITGIVIGILLGLAIALAVALYINAAPSPFRKPAPAQTPTPGSATKPGAGTPAAKADAKPETQKNRFTYYDILPGTEQPVTDQDIKQSPQDKKDQYFLQAGSFQNEVDANNLKAKLALIGVEALIQSASVPDKGVWHRVRVGPFSDIEEMNKARAMLSQNGIQPSLIKVLENAPKQ